MTEKSHVGMLHLVCKCCGKPYDTQILLDTRLKQSLEKDNYQLGDFCDECDATINDPDKPRIALIVCKNRTNAPMLKQHEANRTGEIIFLSRDKWSSIFNIPMPKDYICFLDEMTRDKLMSMAE